MIGLNLKVFKVVAVHEPDINVSGELAILVNSNESIVVC